MMQFIKLLFILMVSHIALLANTPTVSITPVEQNAVIGTKTVYATIEISECPDSKPITVTWQNDANISNNGTVIFENGSCTLKQAILVSIPTSVPENGSFTVSITSAVGQNPQPNPIVGNDTATVNIIPLPANTPSISISPITKNIAIGTTAVDLSVLISECPNKEDINVTYTNEGNLSDTGTLTFTSSSCATTQNFTVQVPAGLTIGDTFDVNISATTSGVQEIGAVHPDTATITILETVSDLNITKTAVINSSTVINTIAMNDTFQYFVRVENSTAYSSATGVVVQDELPAGITIDLTQTNNDSPDWSCSQAAPILTCTYSGDIAPGDNSTIAITATAPGTAGTITNRATVYSDNDTDILNNNAQVTTNVVDTGLATDICYTNSTAVDNHPNTCSDLTGISYYTADPSNICTASLTLRNADTNTPLSSVTVTKLYNPDIDNGSCEPAANCERKTDLGITDYSNYNGGYEYQLGTFDPDTNITISDSGTYFSGGQINDIILYGNYEKEGITYTGKIYACTGGAGALNVSEYAAQVDVADDYDTSSGSYVSWVSTKVSGKDGYVFKAVYLGAYGETPIPQEYHGANDNLSPIVVMLKLVDMETVDTANGETCEASDATTIMTMVDGVPTPVYTMINPGDTFAVTDPFTMAYTPNGTDLESRKNLRFQYQTVDFNELIADSGIQCVNRAADGVVKGIPSCMIANNEGQSEQSNTAIENYIAVFGQEAFDNCYDDNGEPCYASNGGVGAYPYDTPLGCFECTIGAFPRVCSHDNFALRPEKFDINSTDISYPDLMRAGQEYDLNVNAVNYATSTNSIGYNQVSSNLYVANPIKYWGEGGEANASMLGTAVWGSDFNVTNGYTTIGGVVTPVPYAYDEVGDISMHIEDYTWSAVDINNPDDPTPHDCTEDGAYLCGDRNATFIPHHFNVAIDDLHNNGTANAFTYLSNDLNMSARFGVTVTAQNEHNATTRNFTQPQYGHTFYDHPVTVLVTAPNNPTLGAALTKDINTSQLIEFDAGVKTISWDDSNDTLRLGFNYPRAINNPVNPFIVEGNQSRVDVNATYTGTADEGTAYIDGSDDTVDDNVTFVYGRSHMARTRTMCSSANLADCTGNVTLFYEFYGDENANTTLINTLLTNPQRSIDSVNWYRNTLHNTGEDGNVTAVVSTVPGSGTPTITHFTSNSTGAVTYNGTQGYPYKSTLDIYTQSWLIYDAFNAAAPIVTGQLEYYGPGSWSSNTGAETSVKDTGTTNRNPNSNRRIRW